MPDSPQPDGPRYPDEHRCPAATEAVYRVIAERRDVRQGFLPDPVPGDVLARVLAAAHQAPSVGLSQPWDFIVITSRARRERIAALARGTVTSSPPPARRPGPVLRPAEDRVDPEHPGQRRGHLRSHPQRPAHARPHVQPRTARFLQRARGGQPVAGRPGRRPRVGWVSFFDSVNWRPPLGCPRTFEVIAYLCLGYGPASRPSRRWRRRLGAPSAGVVAVHAEEFGRRGLPGGGPVDPLADVIAAIAPPDAAAMTAAGQRQDRMTSRAARLARSKRCRGG